MTDVPLSDLRLSAADLAAVAETLASGWVTQGPRVAAFEDAFAARVGAGTPVEAVATSSATGALTLVYRALGVGPGTEVVVPSYTFVATASAAVQLGATPVFAEVLGAGDLSLDPDAVAAAITPRTRAVVAVHMAGYAAPVARLRTLCDARGVALVEDASHAPGATAGGRPVGTFGDAAVFSFFANKVMGFGEGGMVVTGDAHVAAACRVGRSHGLTTSTWERHRTGDAYDVEDIGFNFRMDEPRAALGLSRLGGLDAELAARRAHVAAYREALAGLPGVTVAYAGADLDEAACYILPVLLDDPGRRDEARTRLREEHGVATSHHYPPVHRLAAYRRLVGEVSLPRTEDAARRELTLPLFPTMTVAQRDRVVDGLRAVLA
jgi:dTDP-4-amino-4,6-dideoxygalactose transaminase